MSETHVHFLWEPRKHDQKLRALCANVLQYNSDSREGIVSQSWVICDLTLTPAKTLSERKALAEKIAERSMEFIMEAINSKRQAVRRVTRA